MNLNREPQIRARVESIYNKAAEDFPDKKAYDDYLEEREDIIFNLVEGEAVAEMEAKLAAYQRTNYENIVTNEARKAEASRLRAESLAAALKQSAPADANGAAAPDSLPAADGNADKASYTATYSGAPGTNPMPMGAGAQPQPMVGELPALPSQPGSADAQLRMALASGWTPDLPKRRAIHDAMTSIFVC